MSSWFTGTGYLTARSQALIAHATQINPDGMWFRVPDEIVRDVYPYDDFEMARSLVPTKVPEDSLFSGLKPVAAATPLAARAGQ